MLVLLAGSLGCGVTVRLDPSPQEEENDSGDEACARLSCPPDAPCVDGQCVPLDPCAGVECPRDQVCTEGSCVHPRVDQDGDGFPVAFDCDDHDPDVVPGSVRPCESDCGEGTETCAEGTWQECTAPVRCACQPGEEREEACGRCGTALRTCSDDGRWGEPGGCRDEGACLPGTVEVDGCPDGACSVRTRECGEECAWGPFSDCTAEREECQPGDSETLACGLCGNQERDCTEACLWGAPGACKEEGVCEPGDVRERPCGDCQVERSVCGDNCTWGEWGGCENPGCGPGALDTRGCGLCGHQNRVCGDECTWGSWSDCLDEGVCEPNDIEVRGCDPCGSQSRSCGDSCQWGDWGLCPLLPEECIDEVSCEGGCGVFACSEDSCEPFCSVECHCLMPDAGSAVCIGESAMDDGGALWTCSVVDGACQLSLVVI